MKSLPPSPLRQGTPRALPHRDPLKASLDAAASKPDAEDDLAGFEELVVSKEGVAAVLRCSEQRASSERALGVLVLGVLPMSCSRARESEPKTASAPLHT